MIYYIRTFEGVRVAGWGDCRVDSPRTRRVTGFCCARVRLNRFLLDSWWLSALGVASWWPAQNRRERPNESVPRKSSVPESLKPDYDAAIRPVSTDMQR